ncbi:histidine kinase, partial [bacterium]|nr:histidine kinase [bacterium]
EEAQREAERIRVLLEMAGAAAHEINQPLTVIVARAELLLNGMPPGAPLRREVESIYEASERIVEIVRKMQGIQQYITKPYALGGQIIDFEAASKGRSVPA